LTTAIGRPEHPGRVRVVGVSVTIRQYFGPPSQCSHTTTSISLEELDRLKQNLKEELTQNIREDVE